MYYRRLVMHLTSYSILSSQTLIRRISHRITRMKLWIASILFYLNWVHYWQKVARYFIPLHVSYFLSSKGTIVFWNDADKAARDTNCDCARIISVINNKSIYKPHRQTAAVYLIQNIRMSDTDNTHQLLEPPIALRRCKWVNDHDLITLHPNSIHPPAFPWIAMNYWMKKTQQIQKALSNYMAMDEANCDALLEIMSIKIDDLLDANYVGKTKRTFNKDLPHNLKHCLIKFIQDEFNVPKSEWKRSGNIVGLSLSQPLHEALFGDRSKAILTDMFGPPPRLVYTLEFEESTLKISEVDENKISVYVVVHVIKIMPNGAIIGQKGLDNDNNDAISGCI
eukprot:74928_1